MKQTELLSSILIAAALGTTIAPLTAFAETTGIGNVSVQYDDSGLARSNRNAEEILASLTPEKAQQWESYFEQNNIPADQQLAWLQYEDGFSHQIQPRWKTWLIEQALKLAAKQVGKAASGALIEKWAAKISGTEADVQKKIASFLVSLGVNKTVAKVVAKGVMFVIG